MSTAKQTLNVLESKGDVVGTPLTPRPRYSSPPPCTNSPGWKSNWSPPPPPQYSANSESGPAADSVLLELNSGHSILNPTKPADIASISLSRKALYKEFNSEAGNSRNVRPRIDSSFILVSPSSHHLRPPSPFSGDASSEEEDDDVPPIVSPVRLSLRSRPRPRAPVAPWISDGFGDFSFVPIQPRPDNSNHDDNGEN
mmetsp:Transcript_23515/g.40121  ORF Transcript_23515/g.40121 Transcript_23515/m.40121 type:complete len:198 (+) Transcript_23515:156-749(+)|eukprot:CAMPEP_0183752352 /NCGR_PEP_ID=MMETSP0739-20130205/2305_1 /TAXON_ID=385413 /ORGANISM="Thalassiosira miniscula, Strain CCMP1093" /LENGTH=197 /DNA_ID=CAMNT_0025988705 /DNA_START=116 /DNA_END=709 /DNA_ORIENTATION=-